MFFYSLRNRFKDSHILVGTAYLLLNGVDADPTLIKFKLSRAFAQIMVLQHAAASEQQKPSQQAVVTSLVQGP